MNSSGVGDRPLVIGIGTPFRGDDGVGAAVVAELRRRGADADLVDADGEGARLLDLWAGRGRAIVVDACRSGAPTGTVTRRDPTDAPAAAARSSSHAVGLAHAIELGRVLDRLPDTLSLITVEGERFEIGAPLSEAVVAAVPLAADLVLAELAAPPIA